MKILLDSAERGDLDDKLLQRTAKVLNEVFCRRELVERGALCEYVIATAERIHDLSSGRSMPIYAEMAWVINQSELIPALRERLIRLDRPPSIAQAPLHTQAETLIPAINSASIEVRKVGFIHNLQERFGFINCNDGSRWFFHRNFLKPDTSWESLTAGGRVTFEVGQNSTGECAIEVSRAGQ